MFVKKGIPINGTDQFGHADPPGRALARLCRADIGAAAAVPAKAGGGQNPVMAGSESAGRAFGDAQPAADAAFGPVYFARQMLPVFGIVAPPTAERTTLHENGGSDPRTVMGREADGTEYGP